MQQAPQGLSALAPVVLEAAGASPFIAMARARNVPEVTPAHRQAIRRARLAKAGYAVIRLDLPPDLAHKLDKLKDALGAASRVEVIFRLIAEREPTKGS